MGRISQGQAAVSWVESAAGSDFPIENLPLGIFSVGERRRRAGVAIGDFVLDLVGIADLLDEEWREDLSQPVLNGWLSRGSDAQSALRRRLQELLSDDKYRDEVEPQLVGQSEVRLHVPCLIGDYTDFYVGIHSPGPCSRPQANAAAPRRQSRTASLSRRSDGPAKRGARHPARSHADNGEDAFRRPRAAGAVVRIGGRRDVLERGADRRPSQLKRLQSPAG